MTMMMMMMMEMMVMRKKLRSEARCGSSSSAFPHIPITTSQLKCTRNVFAFTIECNVNVVHTFLSRIFNSNALGMYLHSVLDVM